ncbi:DNA-binding LacI/PurR family transcriptional regulator [Hamadaea flava]|uniref:LacI family DNA-binding transcriptional regulator n=1 Tax=Hamadaea flava TaxID=1742688 RepID=A0ABV8LSF2_9ACTN|nr:LacI family DNA-binding transcriptional regulator [Hamadaea flava]MCP2328194.1 DNA-binding LacI/PurR family transcriptional regulator [Hamadaea flava]
MHSGSSSPARVGAPRKTIGDIAKAAGVSKGAVSYALNGKPGVSDATRQRILTIARDLGWHPSSAARALSDGRTGVLGLIVDRPARTLGIESFFMQLISGIEATLSARDVGLLLQVTDDQEKEMAAYRHWWAQRRVDGVILVDLRRDDPRVPLLEELGMPCVVIGGPEGLGTLPGIWSDDTGAVTEVVEYLAALGHRRIARVAGLPGLYHTALRDRGVAATAERLGLPEVATVYADYTGEEGARMTRALLSRRPMPTAVIYDNDVMAVAGVAVAHEMGVDIPRELSVVAWDDSPLCQLVHPQLSAVSRDIAAYGSHAAERLLEIIDGTTSATAQDATPRLVPRGSTAPPSGQD